MTDLLVSGAHALQWWLVLAVIAAAARSALGSRWPAGDALAHAVGRWGTVVALTVAIWAVAHALPVFDPIVIRVSTLAVVAAFALMVLLPCAEIALRKIFNSGITGSTPLVQHLELIVGLLGSST